MLADPLTKAGNRDFVAPLIRAYSGGKFSLEPSSESTLRKMKAAKARKIKREEKEELEGKPAKDRKLTNLARKTRARYNLPDSPEPVRRPQGSGQNLYTSDLEDQYN